MKRPDEDFVDSEAYPRRDCWRKVWRGRVKAVLRAEVLKAEVDGVDLNAARAMLRAAEAIVKLLIFQTQLVMSSYDGSQVSQGMRLNKACREKVRS